MTVSDPTGIPTITVDADFLAIRQLGPWIVEHAPHANHGPIELAVQELVVNIIEHAYGSDGTPGNANGRTIEVSLRSGTGPGGCEITTTDRGLAPDVRMSVRPDPDRPQVGGYGMMIVEELTSHVTHTRTDDRNFWVLKFDGP